MASRVLIEVDMDDQGVITGAKNIEGAFEKAGQKGNVVFTAMRKQHEEVRRSVQALSYATGVELPSFIEKAIERSTLFQQVAKVAFNATLIIGMTAALIAMVPKIQSAASELGGFTEKMREFNTEMERMNREASTGFSATGAGQSINANINKRLEALEKERIAAERLAEIYSGTAVLNIKYARDAARIADEQKALELLRIGVIKQRGEVEKKAAVDSDANFQKQKDAALQLEAVRVAGELATLKGVAKIRATWRQYYDDQVSKGVDAVVAQASAQRQATAEIAKYLIEQKQKHKEVTDRIVEFWLRVKGAQIDAAKDAADQSIEQLGKITDAMVADFKKEGEVRIKANEDFIQGVHDLGKVETETEIARAEAVGDSVTAIMLSENMRRDDTLANLKKLFGADVDLSEARAQLNEQTNLKIVQENRQMVNTLGSDLEGIFDDIFSGNIAKRLLDIAKKFFFQLLAQFLLSFGQVRQMFAGGQQNGGGIFGGLLSMIFGGGGGGGIFGGAGGGTTALGGAGGLFNVGLGAPGIVGSGGGIVPFSFGGGASGTLLSGGTGLGTSVQQGVSTVGGANQSLLGRLFGGNQLAGSSILGGSMMGLSAIIGGLQGGGVVNSAIQGGLGGAMTGFGVALLAGGPIGAAVGGAIFLASLLAGIFGGGGSRAKAIANGQFLPQIKKTESDYMSHTIEFQAALVQLGQISQQAHSSLGQLGRPGLKVFSNTISPAIDEAGRHIRATERERQARRDITLNEGQFHVGGLIGSNGMPGGPNEVRIRALAGEYVVNPQATARNLGLLEQINNGGSTSGGGGDTYNFSFLDVGGLREWLDAGGSEELAAGMERFSLRYSGGSA